MLHFIIKYNTIFYIIHPDAEQKRYLATYFCNCIIFVMPRDCKPICWERDKNNDSAIVFYTTLHYTMLIYAALLHLLV